MIRPESSEPWEASPLRNPGYTTARYDVTVAVGEYRSEGEHLVVDEVERQTGVRLLFTDLHVDERRSGDRLLFHAHGSVIVAPASEQVQP